MALTARTRAALAVLLWGLAGCGGGNEGACGPILREELDPGSGVHVLPTAEADYASEPPTSGPHQPGPDLDPVQERPVPRPLQVGVLEEGGFLLQYDPEAVPSAEAEALAGDGLVVAPAPELAHPVVLTAWTAKRTCDALDADAVRDFVDARRGRAPGADPEGD